MLAGPRDVIREAIRHRRMLGGAMRQIGILGAAGLYALDHHIERLSEDHANAQLIASGLRGNLRVRLAADPVETNIVIFSVDEEGLDAAAVVAAARAHGVFVVAFGRRTLRAVTHLDVTREQCERAADVLADVIG
jgi:threonine aldolase